MWAGELVTLGCIRIKSGPSCRSLEYTNKNCCCNFNSDKSVQTRSESFQILSNTICSTFNSAAEQSCSWTKIVPELAFPVWWGAQFYTHFSTFHFTVRHSMNTTSGSVHMISGNSSISGSTLPGASLCSKDFIVAPGQLREVGYPLYDTG